MTVVKVCGLTDLADARVAADAGAGLLGFIFASRSPRRVTPERVKAIVDELRPAHSGIRFVGVFVDAPEEEILSVVQRSGLDAVQLHGDEGPELVERLKDANLFVIKAFRVRSTEDLRATAAHRADAYLLDAYVPERPGGTGVSFDWTLVAAARPPGPILLAGGLTPENVRTAIMAVNPWGVDVASGVEIEPGRKDHEAVRRFVDAVGAAVGEGGFGPDGRGYFGAYGGRFVPETLMPALWDLETAYAEAREDPEFCGALETALRDYVGRPTPLTLARNLTAHCGGARIYLKREDLAHTGAHKINNAIGQGLLAERMGRRRLVAETGAGQHGVATATVAAFLGMTCVVYMGTEDMRRQAPNVARMRLLEAEVRPVDSGSRTLKDAINEAIRDWVTHVDETHYLLGSVLGPHPYPRIVRDFQTVIGREARQQILAVEGRLPDVLIACVGGGSNAIGLFHPFRADSVRMVGVEAGGRGIESGAHAARLGDPRCGRVGVLHGCRTMLLQDQDGQVLPTHSVSAGLDYPAVGPEHAQLRDSGRIVYTVATDEEALSATSLLCRTEGILPALESAHAVAEAVRRAPGMRPDEVLIVNLSGRGDKDLETIRRELGEDA